MQEAFDHFYSEGFVTRIVRPVRSGKEASVWCCEGRGSSLLALKVYHPPERRDFRNASTYTAGRRIINARDRRAVAKGSSWGRVVGDALWHEREWEVLSVLYEAGADVPEPIARSGEAILMAHLGDEETSAPQLRQVVLSSAEAKDAFDAIMRNVEIMLRNNIIHADLSPFNVLWWNGRATIIDVPQAVDPRSNRNASDLLTRDVTNVCRYFSRYGIRSDAEEIARGLWTGFLFADLV